MIMMDFQQEWGTFWTCSSGCDAHPRHPTELWPPNARESATTTTTTDATDASDASTTHGPPDATPTTTLSSSERSSAHPGYAGSTSLPAWGSKFKLFYAM